MRSPSLDELPLSARQNQQSALQQLFRQPVQRFGKLIADRANAHPQHRGCLGLRVFLEHDPAQQHAVKRAELIQAFLHVENEDHRIFEGAHRTAGTPSARDRIAQN